MRTTILDTNYAILEYDSELKMGKLTWKDKATTEEYKHAFITLLDYAEKNNADSFLSDITNQGIVSPKDRKWFETEMLPGAIKAGLKKAAVVFDGSVFKKYYINMIIKVSNKFKLPMKVFNSEDEAVNWFKSID